MRLITEIEDQNIQCITEEKDGKKAMYITGRFMVAEEGNKNGRVYKRPIMESEVHRYMTEMVQAGRAVGELGHPSGPQINLDRVCHLIESLRMDGNNVIGKAKILDTPMGDTVRGLLEGGVNIGVSSRGLGSLKPVNGLMEVQDDFRLITVDIVSDPSGPGCFVKGIMENVEYFYGPDGTIKSIVAEEIKKEVKKMSVRQLDEAAERLFRFYLNKISR